MDLLTNWPFNIRRTTDCELCLCFKISQTSPRWFLKLVRRLRTIEPFDSITTFCARGGLWRCHRCHKIIWPWQEAEQMTNVLRDCGIRGDKHVYDCQLSRKSMEYKLKKHLGHFLSCHYTTGYFGPGVLERDWKQEVDFLAASGLMQKRTLENLRDFPINKVITLLVDYPEVLAALHLEESLK